MPQISIFLGIIIRMYFGVGWRFTNNYSYAFLTLRGFGKGNRIPFSNGNLSSI